MDFPVFWLTGRAIWLGLDPYDPASFATIELPLATSLAFRAEVLAVGSLYPPPTLLLFAPLGGIDFSTAHLLWYALQLLAGAGCAVLLGRLFFAGGVLRRTLFGGALLLSLPLANTTLVFGQTNLLLLLFALLALRDAARPRSGAWIALCAMVKPWSAILAPPALPARDLRALAAMAATGGILLAASAALVGPESFAAFFTDPPMARVPDFLYRQEANQSLLSVAARFAEDRDAITGLVLRGLALAAVLAVVAGSVRLAHAQARHDAAAAASLLLCAALIAYPHALWHYSVCLALPFGWLWSAHGRPSGRPCVAAATLGALVALTGWRPIEAVWLVNVTTWGLVAAASMRAASPPAGDPAAATGAG